MAKRRRPGSEGYGLLPPGELSQQMLDSLAKQVADSVSTNLEQVLQMEGGVQGFRPEVLSPDELNKIKDRADRILGRKILENPALGPTFSLLPPGEHHTTKGPSLENIQRNLDALGGKFPTGPSVVRLARTEEQEATRFRYREGQTEAPEIRREANPFASSSQEQARISALEKRLSELANPTTAFQHTHGIDLGVPERKQKKMLSWDEFMNRLRGARKGLTGEDETEEQEEQEEREQERETETATDFLWGRMRNAIGHLRRSRGTLGAGGVNTRPGRLLQRVGGFFQAFGGGGGLGPPRPPGGGPAGGAPGGGPSRGQGLNTLMNTLAGPGGIGGAATFLGGLTSVISVFGAVVAAVGTAIEGMNQLSDSLHVAHMHLAEFSPSMAGVAARSQLRNMLIQRERGEALAPQAEELEQARAGLEGALTPWKVAIDKLETLITTAFTNLEKGVVEAINDALGIQQHESAEERRAAHMDDVNRLLSEMYKNQEQDPTNPNRYARPGRFSGRDNSGGGDF